jgi:predicted ArsR family transcriptional regulator
MDQRPLADRLSAVTALDDPARRAVYDLVLRRDEPISRDQTAAALGVSRRSAAFHLDRLADQGLLAVEFRRLTGRTGPGAGRPAKLYRRAHDEIAVSVPDRRYDLAGEVMAAAIERALTAGEPVGDALASVAADTGRAIGRSATGLRQALADHGFAPRDDDHGGLLLGNCPFHRLATRHTRIVCGLNLELVRGITAGLGDADHRASLEPGPGHCCVRVRRLDGARTNPTQGGVP